MMRVIHTKYRDVTEEDLIAACRKEDRRAQQQLYERFAPVMFGVCRRYVKTEADAEDVLAEAFFKVFTNLQQYRGQGSFEGWVRRIVVNEALMFLRKRHNFRLTAELSEADRPVPAHFAQQIAANDILGLLAYLPTGYRTVFNLYILEGYKHREISDILGISINTSKSQLILARKRMQELLQAAGYPGLENYGSPGKGA